MEGKHHYLIMNNVSGKLLRTVYSIIHSRAKYDPNHICLDPGHKEKKLHNHLVLSEYSLRISKHFRIRPLLPFNKVLFFKFCTIRAMFFDRLLWLVVILRLFPFYLKIAHYSTLILKKVDFIWFIL